MGGLSFKPGKDACMSCNPKVLHKCFWFFFSEKNPLWNQDFDEFELTKKESLSYDSKEISGQPCNQKALSSNAVIRKYQFNPASRRIGRPHN